MATRLLFAVLFTALLPWCWREVRKWQRNESGPTAWPPTPARVRLVKVGLAVFIALEWLGVALAFVD